MNNGYISVYYEKCFQLNVINKGITIEVNCSDWLDSIVPYYFNENELTQTLELGAFLLYDGVRIGVLFTLARAVKNSVCLIFPSTEWVF